MSMTESEAKFWLDKLHGNILRDRFAKICTENEIIALIESKIAWMELEQYRAIGTVEELRELKEKATEIKSDGFSDHLLNMGYTKGMKDGYAKAIEEFAEALNKRCDAVIKDKWNDGTSPVSWSHAYADFKDDIDEIAKELKKNSNETQTEVKGE